MKYKRYKKFLSILIIAVFLSTTLSAAAKEENQSVLNKEIKDTGTIILEKESRIKDLCLIKADNGIDIFGKHINTFLPINLEEEYQKPDLRVEFTARICFNKINRLPVHSILYCIIYQALPIYITEIKAIEEPEKTMIKGTVSETPVEPIFLHIPVPKAMVSISSEVGSAMCAYVTYTDEYGNYELELNPGCYRVQVSKEGYEADTKEICVNDGEQKTLNFMINKKPLNLEFEIILMKDTCYPEEAISVVATITNIGDHALTISDMMIAGQSLSLDIKTPDGEKLMYFGPMITGWR